METSFSHTHKHTQTSKSLHSFTLTLTASLRSSTNHTIYHSFNKRMFILTPSSTISSTFRFRTNNKYFIWCLRNVCNFRRRLSCQWGKKIIQLGPSAAEGFSQADRTDGSSELRCLFSIAWLEVDEVHCHYLASWKSLAYILPCSYPGTRNVMLQTHLELQYGWIIGILAWK